MNFDDESSPNKAKEKLGQDGEIPVTNGENVPSAPANITVTQQEGDSHENSFVFDTTEEEIEGSKQTKKRRKNKNNILLYSFIIAIVWIVAAFIVVEQINPARNTPTELIAVLMTILGPAAFALFAGVMGDILVRSHKSAGQLARTANKLLKPEATLSKNAKSTISAIREEIEKLDETIGTVSTRLGSLEQNISGASKGLKQVSEDAEVGAQKLVSTMEQERERLNSLLHGISELTKSAQNTTRDAADGLEEKAQLLVEAAQLLAKNTTEANESAQLAATRLDDAVSNALGAINGLEEASQRGETALNRAHSLMINARDDTGNTVDNVNNAIISLKSAAANATQTASQVSEIIASKTADSKQVTEETIGQVRAIAEETARNIAEALRQEANSAKNIAEQSLHALEETTSSIHTLAQQAGQSLGDQIKTNSEHVETLKQHSFEMNLEADKFVENRIINARNLINQSAQLLNDAGSEIEARFGNVAETCAVQARSIEELINSLNNKLSQLPHEAKERAIAVENALEETLTKLSETGKRAAEETYALDAAFQRRLKQSYSALGELVQRLGNLSGVVHEPVAGEKPTSNNDNPADIIPDPFSLAKNLSAGSKVDEPANIPIAPTESDEIKPKFNNILSPKTPVMSSSANKTEDANKNDDYFSEVETKISNKELADKKDAFVIRDNPFEGINLSAESDKSAVKSEWNWRDIFSAIDEDNLSKGNVWVDALINNMGINKIISQIDIDELSDTYINNRAEAYKKVREELGSYVDALAINIKEDTSLRSKIINYVDHFKSDAVIGNIGDSELALLMIAETYLAGF